jgi:protease I
LQKQAVDITRYFLEKRKRIAIICHGVQVLISAGGVKGRKIACWYGVKDDLIAAGGEFVDGVAEDGNIISARHPGDLAEWMRLVLKK